MLNSAQPPLSDDDISSAYREALRGRAEYITHKFTVRRAHEIKPDFLQDVLGDMGGWSQSNTEMARPEITKIRDVENNIYAAMTLYEEPENRNEYYAKLRIIADQLKRI